VQRGRGNIEPRRIGRRHCGAGRGCRP